MNQQYQAAVTQPVREITRGGETWDSIKCAGSRKRKKKIVFV